MGNHTTIRDAASVLVIRDAPSAPRVLMGQRGAQAAFMPSKFVFPGGALDTTDANVPLTALPGPICAARLAQGGADARALAAAAIRELWEETGLMLGAPGPWPAPPPTGWEAFAARGLVPSAAGLSFVFRAITPAGRPRRFDARFFLVDADRIEGDLDDFSAASEELDHLQWIPLANARRFDLPFITEIVLSEVAALIGCAGPPGTVPFFDNSGARPVFRHIV